MKPCAILKEAGGYASRIDEAVGHEIGSPAFDLSYDNPFFVKFPAYAVIFGQVVPL